MTDSHPRGTKADVEAAKARRHHLLARGAR
jgi:hypothetical protein